METASFNGFVRVLFFMIAFYYVIKFLGRIFLPVLVKKAVEKAGESFSQQQRQQQNPYGNVQQTVTPEKPRETEKVGEYVDFEEID